MAKAFHDAGIKVYIDVVYNHTGEGGLYRDPSGRFELTDTTNLLSWHGLDNASYNELTDDKAHYYDNTGVGGNFNTANKVVRDQIIDSLRYWCGSLGVDGFRFDLAPVLGNACTQGCFRFDKLDPNNILNRVFNELPVRPAGGGPGADVIAEPWALGDGTFQLGDFPAGWAEWNGRFRDSLRRAPEQARGRGRDARRAAEPASPARRICTRTTAANRGTRSISWSPMTDSRSATSTRSTAR